jgi:hypothetical protein
MEIIVDDGFGDGRLKYEAWLTSSHGGQTNKV